jgi:predicted acylesterase/phospholipase RssA
VTLLLEPDRHDESKFDLALSGGGVRSSFYSFGVVLYLLHSGLIRRVSTISSVSGGSITNAVLASCDGDISKESPDVLQRLIRRSASRLARYGSFFGEALKQGIVIALVLQVAVIGIYVMLVKFTDFGPAYRLILTSFGGLATGFLSSLVWLWLRRRERQLQVYDRFMSRVAHASQEKGLGTNRKQTAKTLAKSRMLTDLPKSQTNHIFCSTELISGTPFFMTREWAYSPAWGWASLKNVTVGQAIYASAAFPLVFPPLAIEIDPQEWSGGQLIDRPSKIYLADGGVYNNLGTDWRDAVRATSAIFDGVDNRFPSLPPVTKRQIIVNASAPARVVTFDGWWITKGLQKFNRTVTIMYENTVRPRLQQMVSERQWGSAMIIDIADTPLSAAESIVEITSCDEVKTRAAALVLELKSRPYSYWAEYNKKAARVKTTLESVGVEQAAQLLRHGYLSATVVCHAHFGSQGLDSVPDDRWFYNFVRHAD